jgi:hypothetical protein
MSFCLHRAAALSAATFFTLTVAPAAISQTSMPAPMRGTQPPAAAVAPAPTPWVRGQVLETMDAGTYTYVHVDTGSGTKWAAGPKTAVKVGDQVSFPGDALQMKNFESKSLGRRFESIAFVETLVVGDARTAGAAAKDPQTGVPRTGGVDAHAGVPATSPLVAADGTPSAKSDSAIEVKKVARVEGGYTVGEIHDKHSELDAKEVRVRGTVVKYNAGVMGKNWIHLRDGTSSSSGANDLTVTTAEQAKVGDTVVVQGRVGVNRDFGFGYRYDVIVESATVDAEK